MVCSPFSFMLYNLFVPANLWQHLKSKFLNEWTKLFYIFIQVS